MTSLLAFLTALGLLLPGWPSVNLGGGVPATAGATLLFSNGFEGDNSTNCANEYPAICAGAGNPYVCCSGAGTGCGATTDATAAQITCDDAADGAPPEGAEVLHETTSTSCTTNPTWGSVIPPAQADNYWVKFWLKIVAEQTSGSPGIYLNRIAAGTGTNYNVNATDATVNKLRVLCGGGSGGDANNVYVVGTWAEYKVHFDNVNGDAQFYCSAAGGAGCSGGMTTPFASCNGTADAIDFATIMIPCSTDATIDYKVDNVRVYDANPD